MKFYQKPFTKKIICNLTKEDLSSYDVSFEDLLDDEYMAGDFINDLLNDISSVMEVEFGTNYEMQAAEEENGDVTVVLKPDTEKEEIDDDDFDMVDFSSIDIPDDFEGSIEYSLEDKEAEIFDTGDEESDEYSTYPLCIAFKSLEDVISYSKAMPKLKITSMLYSYKKNYYLQLLGVLTKRDISAIKLASYDFALDSEEFDAAYIAEHGKFICKNPHEKLAQI